MENKQTTYYIPALAPIYDRLDDLAWPLIRVMFGLFFIPDGCVKLFGWWAWAGNVEATGAFMDKIGISPVLFWAYYEAKSGISRLSMASDLIRRRL